MELKDSAGEDKISYQIAATLSDMISKENDFEILAPVSSVLSVSGTILPDIMRTTKFTK